MQNPISIAIHGGAGTISRSRLTPALEAEYIDTLRTAASMGYQLLAAGGTALDVVEDVVTILENSPLFNAGRGAVFNHEGKHSMDAAIMDGSNLKAGAVAGVSRVKNPVSLARKVLEKSAHVLLSGEGAYQFAWKQGLELMPEDYFFDQHRYNQWQQLKEKNKVALDHSDTETALKVGTVGAVALDRNGNLAAATSTGGMTNKRWGRIGDSPIIGAGNYANNATCAVSCTGHGEHLMRYVTAYDISAMMEYGGLSLQQAAHIAIMDKLGKHNYQAGLVAADAKGNLAVVFNTTGMYRAWQKEGEALRLAIFENVYTG